MTTHEKALEAAVRVKADLLKDLGLDANSSVAHANGNKMPLWQAELEDTASIISAYLSALTPPDVEERTEFAERAEGSCRTSDLTAHEWQQAYFDETGRLERTLTHLAAENALLREREGWLPIETAPRDGTVVLCGWFEDDGTVYAVAGWYEAGIADCRWYDQYDDAIEPTHWRSLPASPSHQEQNNG